MYLRRSKTTVVLFIAFVLGLITAARVVMAHQVQERQPQKKVKRVQRPTFTEKDSEGIFFANLFEEGLVGDRPSDFGKQSANQQAMSLDAIDPATSSSSNVGEFAWSKFIDGASIEDEIKRLQIQLNQFVTTPTNFKSDYGKARQAFSMLSMLFAVINEYDQTVRWKEFASSAQVSFAQAASNARVGSQQAYNGAKLQKENLQELIRGGKFASDAKPEEDQDWSSIVDRNPVMERLEIAMQDRLKPWTSSQSEFSANAEDVLHEANLIAVMGQVLIQSGMEESDDEDYAAFANTMSRSALDVIAAVKNNDFASASKAANGISQTCSNCHEDYR